MQVTGSRKTPHRALDRWLSLRAMACHVTLLILVPAFLTAAWWQAKRAAAGNELSYLYVVEWPAFAVVAVWAWWQIIHLPPRAWGEPSGAADAGWLTWDRSSESPQLKAYNTYLAELNRADVTTRPARLGWRRAAELPAGEGEAR